MIPGTFCSLEVQEFVTCCFFPFKSKFWLLMILFIISSGDTCSWHVRTCWWHNQIPIIETALWAFIINSVMLPLHCQVKHHNSTHWEIIIPCSKQISERGRNISVGFVNWMTSEYPWVVHLALVSGLSSVLMFRSKTNKKNFCVISLVKTE